MTDEQISMEVAKLSGIIPCEEWRALEWDGVIRTFCPVHRTGCYCVGIREGSEYTDKENRWANCEIKRISQECDYNESKAELHSLEAYLTSLDAIVPVIKKQGEEIMARICVSFFDDNRDQVDDSIAILTATPRQLCEKLLKACGKWKE